ncbi:M14 metallopeptidase family protein [Psychroserpens sp. XS_ASV72]|uniref:M14 family metallopeptidase n=1 Tax=Psychroserpens sp. XS_ASV72 TaxID=3241293 RepID=UPI003516213E
MSIDSFNFLFKTYKENTLYGRYINTSSIEPILKKRDLQSYSKIIGHSVLGIPIYNVTIGSGQKRVLMWSQMHGNESTTTKAVFDLLNFLTSEIPLAKNLLSYCTISIIPILNPDGAKAYTRFNANEIDLNRDAQDLSQPESKVLRDVFDEFQANFCFNLHGQRTIFSAGKTNKPATVSFLSPAQDAECSLTENRKVAMALIASMNENLQQQIPGQVGVYDDAFNLNCVGDTFQSFGVPTVLFEAGHYPNDYDRDITRGFIFQSLLIALQKISENGIDESSHQAYFDIPENQKLFYDVLIRNSTVGDIGILYTEKLIGETICFVPKVEKISNLESFYGHKELDANGHQVLDENGKVPQEGYEIDFVSINNEKFSLKLKKK